MDIDKLIEKTQRYRQLRTEIISEIPQIVSKAKVINEILYSIVAIEENIDISESLMDYEIDYLSDINEDTCYDISHYFDELLELKYKLDSAEAYISQVSQVSQVYIK